MGALTTVVRNDAVDLTVISEYDGVLVSPGPGTPADAGASMDVIRACAAAGVPMLGICLGHQALAEVFGAVVSHAPELMHGKTSLVSHDGDSVLAGLPSPFTATRYHSLAVENPTVPGHPRGHVHHRQRHHHGVAPQRAAAQRRAIPPGVGAHRGRAPPAGELARGVRDARCRGALGGAEPARSQVAEHRPALTLSQALPQLGFAVPATARFRFRSPANGRALARSQLRLTQEVTEMKTWNDVADPDGVRRALQEVRAQRKGNRTERGSRRAPRSERRTHVGADRGRPWGDQAGGPQETPSGSARQAIAALQNAASDSASAAALVVACLGGGRTQRTDPSRWRRTDARTRWSGKIVSTLLPPARSWSICVGEVGAPVERME